MKADLTRWNRAGLSRFRYVDGNAATYLEALRQSLLTRFPQWQALDGEIDPDETASQRLARLQQQYEQSGREWGWEIARSFTRASHVLSEHLDAYANEAQLGTASQWDNVRRLVDMIGYSPAPPASADTGLVLLAKEDMQGMVAAGWQIKYSPEQGDPVIFETLEDVEIATVLNSLRLAGWNKNDTRFSAASASVVWQLQAEQQMSSGAVAVLLNLATDQALVVVVSDVSEQGPISLQAGNSGDNWNDWSLGDSKLLFDAARVYKPRLKGAGVAAVRPGHGFSEGDVVAWQDSSDDWQFRQLQAVDSHGIETSGSTPQLDAVIYKAQLLEAQAGESNLLYPDGVKSKSTRKNAAAYWPSVTSTLRTSSESTYGFDSAYYMVDSSAVSVMYIVAETAEALTEVTVAAPTDDWIFPGGPGELSSGDWLVGERQSGSYFVLQVKAIEQREDEFTLRFETSAPDLARLYGPFRETLHPQSFDKNTTALGSSLRVELASGVSLSRLLKVGRLVMLEQVDSDGETVAAHQTRIVSIQPATGNLVLDSMPSASAGFTLANTLLRGNVVQVGHGESKPGKLLGSGDAASSFQRMVFKEQGVSFVTDATQPSGVRAAIDITVAGQTWQQVASLDDAEASDPHYSVRMTEDGGLTISFGDGEHGRRLPTGSNNVRIVYRKGSGLTGNVPVGSLLKPIKPHPKIDKLRQPLKSSGGNDMEALSDLRDNAPGALFTLQRAVSISDYARLAERHSSVWQASAFALPNRGAAQERLEVVVVPADGGELGALQNSLRDYLQQYGLPGVAVSVSNHIPVPFGLNLTLRVDSQQYEPLQVVEQVRSAVLAAFSLRRRRLGQALYRSEIYQIVEAVAGVENSRCLIDGASLSGMSSPPQIMQRPGGVIRLIQPSRYQLLLLDKILSSITVTTEEFER